MKRIAVIDDSKSLLEAVERVLRHDGYEVVALVEASRQELTRRGPWALVLLDINMPQAFGDDVVGLMKESWLIDAPIYLYSQIPEDELWERVERSGADGAIAKAWGVQVLLQKVREIAGPTSGT